MQFSWLNLDTSVSKKGGSQEIPTTKLVQDVSKEQK